MDTEDVEDDRRDPDIAPWEPALKSWNRDRDQMLLGGEHGRTPRASVHAVPRGASKVERLEKIAGKVTRILRLLDKQ